MSRLDDMVNGLRDEMDIPENVWRGYVQTLAELPEKGGNGGIMKNYDKNYGKSYGKNQKGGRRRKSSAGMAYLRAAALILISVMVLGIGVYASEKYFGILDFLRESGN